MQNNQYYYQERQNTNRNDQAAQPAAQTYSQQNFPAAAGQQSPPVVVAYDSYQQGEMTSATQGRSVASFIPQPTAAQQFQQHNVPPQAPLSPYAQPTGSQQQTHPPAQVQHNQPHSGGLAQPFARPNPPNFAIPPPQMGGSPYSSLSGHSASSFATGSTGSGGDFFKDPTAQLGLQIGNQMLNVGQDYVQKNLGGVLPTKSLIKTYFHVNDSYVARKLGIIVFPWRHANWQRTSIRDPATQSFHYLPPREDLNSPDLYIPVMAVVSYVLLVGLLLGLRQSFNPESLKATASGAIIFVLLELVIVKFGAYLLGFGSEVYVLDMIAVIGYNFVPLIITLLSGLIFGRMGRYAGFIYCSFAMAFFMLRSLRYSFIPESSMVANQRRTRVYFLFGIVAIQIICSYFLLY